MTNYRDNFNRASLGADWTSINGTWGISGSSELECSAPPSSGVSSVRYEHDLDGVDHACRIEFTSDDGNSLSWLGPCVRHSASAATYYAALQRVSGGVRQIRKVVNGSATGLASDSGGGKAPTTLTLAVDGSSLALYHNKADGTPNLTVTDTSITGNTRCGLQTGNQPTADPRADDFHAYDLPSTYTLWVELSPDPDSDSDRSRGRYKATVDGVETILGCLTSNAATSAAHSYVLRSEDISDIFDPTADAFHVRWQWETYAAIDDSQHVRRMWIENTDGSVVWEDQYHLQFPASGENCVAKDGVGNPRQRDPCNLSADYETDVYGDGHIRHIFLPVQTCGGVWRITHHT